jgi:hypothetical protein
MIIVLQVAGAFAALIGVVALYYGIPVKEFSFGNTLILVGTMSLCTGAILFALSMVALELRMMARRLTSVRSAQDSRAKPALPPFPPSAGTPLDDGSPSFEQSTAVQVEPPRVPPVPEAAPSPPPKSKRNLLFQSSMRRDRERPETRPTEPPPLSAAETGETPPANFEDAWPRPDRTRGSETTPRRSSRLSARPTEASGAAGTPPSPPQPGEQGAVTVLKSGVVDGMAYSLYSDGSIEAEMPEGMMRFASIDELRAHLDHRP